jgi:hypothetical protein
LKRNLKKLLIVYFTLVAAFSIAGYFAFYDWLTADPPDISNETLPAGEVSILSDSLRVWGNNALHKNDKGLYELYIEGSPYSRGYAAGKLEPDLIAFQEKAFMDRIGELVPSMSYQRFLRLLIAVFNHNIATRIPVEYQKEIYGISKAAPQEYDYVGPAYDRMLQYHGAHDIGHMLQNFSLVGCSSFAAWNAQTDDSALLIARNFDFYVGDEFAKNKIIEFCKPDSGYGFMMVTWGGMCGTVSGMNEQGLTVTINAAKSVIPVSAADPVSLIAREMLQYARTIDEAYAIALKRSCFVSESFLIGSAVDHAAAVIEKSPYAQDVYRGSNDLVVCTNHFQSKTYRNDSVNVRHIRESASMPRYIRLNNLIQEHAPLSLMDAAEIMRDRLGPGNRNIGMGNEKTLNQLIAHHSIIFKPEQGLVWISTPPYQLGEYIAYDLKAILNNPKMIQQHGQFYKKELTLQADTFLLGTNWSHYQEFLKMSKEIRAAAEQGKELTDEFLKRYIATNPEYFLVYEICGDYCQSRSDVSAAASYYGLALKKDIPAMSEQKRISEKLARCTKKKN